MKWHELLNKPKVITVAADVNEGKSMLLYYMLDQLNQKYDFSVYTYGMRAAVEGARQVWSVGEIERIENSIIIIDELSSLFDLTDRKQKRTIENFMRLINHNNNILILCGTPENFKKFLAAKADIMLFKRCTIADFINGSRLKQVVIAYRGAERGSEVLNIDKGHALVYDGNGYQKIPTPYLRQYDTKADNQPILKKRTEKRANIVRENVTKRRK